MSLEQLPLGKESVSVSQSDGRSGYMSHMEFVSALLRKSTVFVDQTPGKDNVSPEVQSPTAKRQVASVPHTTNHSPTVPTNIQEYNIDS
jgi:hypothetical protein